MSVLTPQAFTASDLLNIQMQPAVQLEARPHQLFHVLVFACLGIGLKMGRSSVQGILPKTENDSYFEKVILI